MVKKCSKCGETKDVRQFRIIKAEHRRSGYCKSCEGEQPKEDKSKTHKRSVKKAIYRNWTELSGLMDQCEFDNELYRLKEIYREVQESKNEKRQVR